MRRVCGVAFVRVQLRYHCKERDLPCGCGGGGGGGVYTMERVS
jgi:hypothetical protein